jgi:hypothetical protein
VLSEINAGIAGCATGIVLSIPGIEDLIAHSAEAPVDAASLYLHQYFSNDFLCTC